MYRPSVISELGYEGLSIESLLKLTSRMLIRCDMAEDEELLALASDVYRMGKYDEVILKYLMDYRCPCRPAGCMPGDLNDNGYETAAF